ncbi:MAG: lipid-A-disaccharide synthase, partial [Candidatus Methanomethylicia archaeon]
METIWIDTLTPKQALLSIKIKEAVEKIGFKTIITTREYDYTTKIYELNNLKPIIVGRHGGK